eukprot:474181-Pleurochrysis_carterae.AAC.2
MIFTQRQLRRVWNRHRKRAKRTAHQYDERGDAHRASPRTNLPPQPAKARARAVWGGPGRKRHVERRVALPTNMAGGTTRPARIAGRRLGAIGQGASSGSDRKRDRAGGRGRT